MAYLIFTTLKGRELARQALRETVTVGRAPECEVCVHDILLSRQHCRFEADGAGWVLIDLASKNGTHLNDLEFGDREIGRHALQDGQTFRIGKTAVVFCAGACQRASRGGSAYDKPNQGRARPADPWSALHDTMSGFDYVKSLADQKKRRVGAKAPIATQMPVMVDVSRLPSPQPTPPDPNAYRQEDIYSLLTDLASSSWDSIYMNASRPAPTRQPPRPMPVNHRHPRQRNTSPVDLSLPPRSGPGLLEQPAKPKAKNPPRRWRRTFLGMARGFATVGQSVLLLGIAHLLSK